MVEIAGTDYDRALEWIHSTMRFGSRMGLERIRKLRRALGQSEKRPEYVHVAGTNGKGSVTAMVASALSVNGTRPGDTSHPISRTSERGSRLGIG